MECPVCQSPVPGGGTWCLYCGAAVKEARNVEVDEPPALEEADRLRKEGLYREAITIYARLAEAAPTDAEKAGLFEILGDTYCEQGNNRGAIKIYREAIQLQPSDTLRQKYDQAIDHLHAAPAPPGPPTADRPRMTTGSAKVTITTTPTDAEESAELLNGLDAWRKRLTPKTAAMISTAAVMAVFAAVLFTSKPWIEPYTPPKKTLAITEQAGQRRIPPPSATPANPGAPVTTPGQPGSTRIHHSKPKPGGPR